MSDALITKIHFENPSGTIRFFDSSGNLFYTLLVDAPGYQDSIPLDETSPQLLHSVLSAEDKNFYKHPGIDISAIFRALSTNIREGHVVSGGSTITQQVVKGNLFKANIGGNYFRKLREINSALWLDLFYKKEALLEYYLNNAYFGNNSYGVEAASYTYYGKKASQLSLTESATIAGAIKAPNSLNPLGDNSEVMERRNEVLRLMHTNGNLPEEELNIALEVPIAGSFHSRPEDFIHFAEYALEESMNLLNLSSIQDLSGLSIYTTLNTPISNEAQKSARDQVYTLKEEHNLSNASVVVLSGKDSAILSMIGSVDYFDDSIDGAVNIATSLRQPGSALKPITYAQAFYEGHLTPDTIIVDEKTTFTDTSGKSFVPYNYNGEFNGPVSARVALASSLNLPAVKVLDMVGVNDMVEAAQKLGIHSLNDPERYDLSVTLGGGEVTLLELTNAYASLSRKGAYINPYSVISIENSKGEELYIHLPVPGVSVWGEHSENISATIYDILSSSADKVLGFGRNNVLVLPFKSASKTGTTTDWHDNWTVGYTMDTPSDFVVGVWVGNSDHSPMYQLDGVTGAGPIWREVMLFTHDLYLPDDPLVNSSDSNGDVASPSAKALGIPTIFQVTNPPNNSTYYSLSANRMFEKIKLETSRISNMHSVEFVLDGESLGKFYDEDNFGYLWSPIEGSHTLEALCRASEGQVIAVSESNFTVYKD